MDNHRENDSNFYDYFHIIFTILPELYIFTQWEKY